MSYQITITETRTVKKICGKDWAVVGQKEEERDYRYSKEQGEPKTHMVNVHGYTPEIEKDVTEEREVLKQTVEELDLTAVIKAINKIE